MVACLMAVLAVAPASRLQLDLQPPLPCHLDRALPDALLLQQVEVSPAHEAAPWSLHVEQEVRALRFRLVDARGAVHGERTIELAEGDCPVLARSVALLVKSWMLMEPRLAEAPRPPPIHARPAPLQLPPVRAAELDGPPVPAALPVTAPAPAAGAPEVHAVLAPVARPAPGVKFGVMLTGGGSVGLADAPVVTGSVRAELAFNPRFALGVEGGLQSTRAQTVNTDSVAVQLTWAGLAARLAFALSSSDLLCLALGGRLVHLDANGGHAHADVFLPALNGRAEVRHAIAGGVFLLAGVGVDARLFPEQVVNGQASLTIPPWGAGIEVGAGWNFP